MCAVDTCDHVFVAGLIEKLAAEAAVGNVNATVKVICPPVAEYVAGLGVTVAVCANARATSKSDATMRSRHFFMGNRMAEWARNLRYSRQVAVRNTSKRKCEHPVPGKESKLGIIGHDSVRRQKSSEARTPHSMLGLIVCQRVLRP